ncbi:MAG: FeoA domain-containing protein [Candidatus Latescibacterota bacterium]
MGLRWRHRRGRAHAPAADVLSEWGAGAEGVITEVIGSSRLATRLRELGAVPGERIRVLRTACPLIVQVGQGRFCLRRHDAAAIGVRLLAPGSPAARAAAA